MLFTGSNSHDAGIFALRAKDLVTILTQEQPEIKKGAVVLFGGFEQERYSFRQESSFYYFTGITEPGSVAVFNLDGKSILYVPDHGNTRAAWVHTTLAHTPENAKKLGFDEIRPLGDMAPGYQFHAFSDKKHYSKLIADFSELITHGGKIFTLMPDNAYEYIDQRWQIERFNEFIPGFKESCINICPIVAILRRKKDMREIEKLYKAVEITILAQGAAAQAISDGMTESEVQASLEYMFTGSGARPAFPSIVATGKNGTILHYNTNRDVLKNGQLVVVDIGAEMDYYCADLTRTYPVSGTFSKRQKELYNLVLECQELVASKAKPGMWLSNKDKPEQSLHHIAKKFFDERGYGKYFIHGIGHFMGIDVHDVGAISEPLRDGDVFTIEPGIYIPEENIGIRIEDDYWMVKDGVVCLSEALPKKAEDIEAMMLADTEPDEEEEFDENELSIEEDEDLDLAQS